MDKSASRRLGFTLVELLVVIAIIAVLVAILMPVIGSAREKSRQARCLSNMMQINTALRVYKADYGRYPFAPYFDANLWKYQGGPNCLYPDYVSSKANLICPNDATLRGVSNPPANYCSYSGVIAKSGNSNQASYWNFANFTDPDGFSRYQVTYNWAGFDNDGWDETWYNGGVAMFKYPSGGPVPQWLAQEGKKWRHYPRLGNSRAPDNTIVMRCVHHHSWYGNNPSRWRDVVVRLGGEGHTVDYQSWAAPDPVTGASQWKVQK